MNRPPMRQVSPEARRLGTIVTYAIAVLVLIAMTGGLCIGLVALARWVWGLS